MRLVCCLRCWTRLLLKPFLFCFCNQKNIYKGIFIEITQPPLDLVCNQPSIDIVLSVPMMLDPRRTAFVPSNTPTVQSWSHPRSSALRPRTSLCSKRNITGKTDLRICRPYRWAPCANTGTGTASGSGSTASPLTVDNAGICSEITLVSVPTGVDFEVIHVYPSKKTVSSSVGNNSDTSENYPPLVFIHGSKHGAWCFHLFQSHFARLGYNTYSISLRGNGGSVVQDILENGKPKKKVKFTVDECVADLQALWPKLKFTRVPIIIAHSIGGFIVQKLIASSLSSSTSSPSNDIPTAPSNGISSSTILCDALVLLASSPPSGNGSLVWRVLFSLGLGTSWDIVRAFTTNALATDVALCKKVLFSPADDDTIIETQYMPRFAVTPDTPKLDTRTLTSIATLPASVKPPKSLVVRGSLDVVVDQEAAKETSKFWNGDCVVVDEAPHDLMLYHNWEQVADTIMEWISKL